MIIIKDKYIKLIDDQLDWLSELIVLNGEFIMSPLKSNNYSKIVPYFSNIAATSLLLNDKYYDIVKKYLSWYISKLNNPDKYGVVGTIYDYNLRANGELISTEDYDSYDSYPATFFSLARQYFDKTRDTLFFIRNKAKFDMIKNSFIESMDNEDHLTWAKPNYRIKYLMDNCEVYRGLEDAAYLYEFAFDDLSIARKLNVLSLRNLFSIQEKLWNAKQNYYYYQIDEKDKKYDPNFKKWYPDATSQLFPILHGVIDMDSIGAKRIYKKFNEYQPNWYNENSKGDFPNTYIGYVAAKMKDFERVTQFIDYCVSKYINNDNKWPWNCFESAYFVKMIDEYRTWYIE